MINDNMLTEVAKSLNGESFVIPAYLVFGSDVITISTTSTSLPGEMDRDALTASRDGYTVEYVGLKSSTTVASSDGEYINAIALNSSSSGGTHLSEALLSSILHTTNYDIEVLWNITVDRA